MASYPFVTATMSHSRSGHLIPLKIAPDSKLSPVPCKFAACYQNATLLMQRYHGLSTTEYGRSVCLQGVREEKEIKGEESEQ